MMYASEVELSRLRRMLAKSRISIVTSHPDAEVARLQALIGDPLQADGRSALEEVLGRLCWASHGALGDPAPKTLDLIGHATSDGLLRIGDWVLDAESRAVTAFFRGLADVELLPSLGVTQVRLLGCSTAVTKRAKTTLAILSELLGMQVIGTRAPIYSLHYDETGFAHQWRFLLSSGEEPEQAPPPIAARRALDVDGLPLVPLLPRTPGIPRHLLSGDDARSVLELIDRAQGAQMPGLLAIPSHELALPTRQGGQCHLVEVILEGSFVRVYPEGLDQPGIVYPVTAPRLLVELVSRTPTV